MTTNLQGMVDVRFFGDHDRAFVPIRECYLYSKDHPNPITVKSKRQSIAHSVVVRSNFFFKFGFCYFTQLLFYSQEVDKYIKKVTAKYGSFVFPECKTLFDPFREEEQLEQVIPNYRSYTNALTNKKSTSNSDLTYKIVKTADNNLSIFKKNDKPAQPIQPQEGVHEKTTQHAEEKHGKNATIEAVDDLKYQVLKRDKETSRMDGRVDSVILKRKAESPSPNEAAAESRKKMKLITNYRRMSTPTVGEESSTVASCKSVAKIPNDRQTTTAKTDDGEQSKIEMKNQIDRQSSSKSRETPSKDVVSKSHLKEDLISAVVKKLDKLEAFVSTNDNCKGKKEKEPISQTNRMPEKEQCNDSGTSDNTVDRSMTATTKRKVPNKPDQSVVATNSDKNRSDEDDNLLVPMQDRRMREMTDTKKELQLAAITSSRQGSMSGSSIQSVTGSLASLDDPYEMSIKTEPLSDDEMDSSTVNDDSSERIVSPLETRSLNGSHDSSFSKISVKNISLMTKPLEQIQRPQVPFRKGPFNKSSKCLVV